jgi:D-alanyl-D-alanine carboxypeptidase/D-alanyl-D-alanine-endopeptidase (penicillin-binding protein 4)
MRRRVLAALALWLIGPARAGAEAEFGARLDAALAARELRGARTAALVVAREDGRVLYARSPDRALIPASNLKILTAIAALAAFGPTHRFTTELLAEAAPDSDGAIGVLSVRGSDPALTSEQVWRLAADLRRLGLRRVRGGLLLDDSAFDGEHWHPRWGEVSARAYHAPVGALTVNYGAFAVEVGAGANPGDPVRAFVDPPLSLFRVSNRARTGPASARDSLAVERGSADGLEHLVVSGVVPAGSPPETYYRSVRNPARYAGGVIRAQLEANGIAVEGETRAGIAPDSPAPLLVFEGKPLAEIVRLLVKFSNNAIAESLLKAMGARATGGPGTWESGLAAMRDQLVAAGLDMRGVTLADGSGLSYENRVPPRALVEALRLADRSFRFGPELVAALPIAAADGTLEERAEGAAHAVRAKTGLLTRVTALSGFAQLGDGAQAVFSVIVNGYRGSDEAAMEALDRFVSELTSDP